MRFDRRLFLRALFGAGAATVAPSLESSASSGTPIASPVQSSLPDEDGYELWLRYRPVKDARRLTEYRSATTQTVQHAPQPFADSIGSEINKACEGMLGQRPAASATVTANGAILIGTPATSPEIKGAIDAAHLASLGEEGFVLKTASIGGHQTTVIAANHGRGLLYGTFALIKKMQLDESIDSLDISDSPRANIRMVNHWDDMDRTVNRGYAGLSIFGFPDLTAPNPRYVDYARLLASVGLNGTVINDVDASANFLDSKMMAGYTSLSDVLRPWGIRLFLSVNFASPIDLTSQDTKPITTADPLDERVQAWWSQKAEEIYRAVPDFGGFLVKANSEGEPGPLNYNRTHAQGANMLARPLESHGGIVIWRSFVHEGFQGWAEFEYDTFHVLDGQFAKNVIVQTKNGPIDFQVREPVNPLFGAMPRTNQMIEMQITQEYTGHATHLCYLPIYWSLILNFGTHISGEGPTVAGIIDGSADDQSLTGLAGVINFGDDRNWTGSYLAAANTHGFARLAWDHTLPVQGIAAEWTKLTFGDGDQVVSTLTPVLQSSWSTYQKYTSPFGVGYLTRPTGAHYLPDPRGTEQLTHFTDSQGSGYDRTLATGTGFTRFYSDYWFDRYEHLESCPEDLMMFMQIVPWNHTLASGKSTIQQMYDDHFAGVEEVRSMGAAWQSLEGRIDPHRFSAVSRQFERHLFQTRVWRDVLLSYYFDIARTIGNGNPWVQLEMRESPNLLLGGSENDLPVQMTNATKKTQRLRVKVEMSQGGWKSTTVDKEIHTRESRDAVISVTPPIEPFLGPIGFSCEPAALTTLGFDTQAIITASDAKYCTFALDIGTRTDKVVRGYSAITDEDLWSDTTTVGWVGNPPNDIWLGDNWGLLLDHCASGNAPHALRLQIPSGRQRAWALIGGEGTGSQPVRISLGRETLVETGYLEENAFQWAPFELDGGTEGKTIDLSLEGADGRQWRLSALVVLKPGL